MNTFVFAEIAGPSYPGHSFTTGCDSTRTIQDTSHTTGMYVHGPQYDYS